MRHGRVCINACEKIYDAARGMIFEGWVPLLLRRSEYAGCLESCAKVKPPVFCELRERQHV